MWVKCLHSFLLFEKANYIFHDRNCGKNNNRKWMEEDLNNYKDGRFNLRKKKNKNIIKYNCLNGRPSLAVTLKKSVIE